MRRLQRQLPVIGVVNESFRVVRIYVGIFKKPSFELGAQDVRDRFVDRGIGNSSLVHLIDKARVSILKREFDFNPGLQGHLGSFLFGGDYVMKVAQVGYTEV